MSASEAVELVDRERVTVAFVFSGYLNQGWCVLNGHTTRIDPYELSKYKTFPTWLQAVEYWANSTEDQ